MKTVTRIRFALAAVVAVAGWVGSAGAAVPGTLDATFGTGGSVVTSTSTTYDTFNAVAVQSDGKIVAVGQTKSGTYDDMIIARFTTAGTLDPTFSGDGIATFSAYSENETADAVAIQPDGKIVVVGKIWVPGSSYAFAVLRYNTNGSLDTSFNFAGWEAYSATSPADERAVAVALQPDGKIVVAGLEVYLNSSFPLVLRINANGSVDTTFSGDGWDIPVIFSEAQEARAVAVQPDGRILFAGWKTNYNVSGDYDFLLYRYNADGTPDTTFDGDGLVVTSFGSGDDRALALALQPDGKILAAGYASGATATDVAIARYTSTGNLDATFGSGGTVTTAISAANDGAAGLSLMSDGKIVVAGGATVSGSYDVALARYLGTGALDPAFGTSGIVTTAVRSHSDGASGLAFDSTSDTLVVAGYSWDTTYSDSLVARYLAFGCGDGEIDDSEQCDDGNVAGGDCCSAACQFEAGGAACADDGSACSTDLCDGAGSCVHAPVSAGVECRAAGYESSTGLSFVDEGDLEFPIAIDEDWFSTHECGDGSAVTFFPASGTNCTGFHTFSDTPASSAKLKTILDALEAGTYTTPATTAGQTFLSYVGGTVAAAVPDMRDLFNLRKNASGEWTFLAPVYASSGCANPSGSLLVVGFATVTLETVQTSPTNLVLGRIDCNVLPEGEAEAGDFGTHVMVDQECDIAEYCDGTSTACPADAKQSPGTPCEDGGFPYYACAADLCDGAGVCTHPVAAAGTVCRDSSGVCDPAELCDGTSFGCPADLLSTAVCRPGADSCDATEVCDGTSGACPADALEGPGTVCRSAAGVCDFAETCSGTSADCPADAFDTAECRPAAGVCDTAESCQPGNADCPIDQKRTDTCRASAGVCDTSEVCDGAGDECPADLKTTGVCRSSSGVCDEIESCDGVSTDCPADAKSTAVCRGSAGTCDVAESCDGVADGCPADMLASGICRESAGVCDPTETCDGVAAACPADARSSAVCRAAAGVCDVAEACDGIATDCPADGMSTAACRESAGACDLAETCDGLTADCPADDLVVAGTACRPSIGICDAAEACTGTEASCPADTISPAGAPCGDPTAGPCNGADTCGAGGACNANQLAAGTPCNDGDVCTTGDACTEDGLCAAGDQPLCDDGNPCTVDSCAAGTGDCTFDTRPATGCRISGKSGLGFTTRADGKARWKWGRGEATTCEDLGAPDVDTGYDACIYDGTGGGEYALASHFALPANGTWELGNRCRWTYEDRSASTEGITSLRLSPGEPGRASIQFGAGGASAPLPVPVSASRFVNMDPNVTVQIHNSLGICWESEFTEAHKNTPEKFKTTRLILVGGLELP